MAHSSLEELAGISQGEKGEPKFHAKGTACAKAWRHGAYKRTEGSLQWLGQRVIQGMR